jgi:hypothetical protein
MKRASEDQEGQRHKRQAHKTNELPGSQNKNQQTPAQQIHNCEEHLEHPDHQNSHRVHQAFDNNWGNQTHITGDQQELQRNQVVAIDTAYSEQRQRVQQVEQLQHIQHQQREQQVHQHPRRLVQQEIRQEVQQAQQNTHQQIQQLHQQEEWEEEEQQQQQQVSCEVPLKEKELVDVDFDTSPGNNKTGGVARITRVNEDGTYDVSTQYCIFVVV